MGTVAVTGKPGNYLRVRGEYTGGEAYIPLAPELPPRARRIRPLRTTKPTGLGTTSACAENTLKAAEAFLENWNYLRVRGEYGRYTKTR